MHSEMVVRTAVGATDRVHGIDTTVIVDVFSRLHGGNNAAVLRAICPLPSPPGTV